MEAGLTAEQVDLVDKRRFPFHHFGLSSRKYNKLLKIFLTDTHCQTKTECSVLP